MEKLVLLLLILLGWFQYSFWLGENGIYDYKRINENIILQQEYNSKIKKVNSQLIIEIEDLNCNLDAIEERARSELGMIKPGETFYRFIQE
ncbi:cell division protein FtsB [Pantoea sp. Aalb]|uniref:cell division protein FtsB n=1 Tax=Pantoea sp. Aalb TaxID=2576762 RepID=UPI00132A3616|nr:cell division protein FtsB [Pantoea sp. Aalb]MXP67763.1 cell division protein FtsB [Pantoea sp. Aalb]